MVVSLGSRFTMALFADAQESVFDKALRDHPQSEHDHD
jgi:hypothetical protein